MLNLYIDPRTLVDNGQWLFCKCVYYAVHNFMQLRSDDLVS